MTIKSTFSRIYLVNSDFFCIFAVVIPRMQNMLRMIGFGENRGENDCGIQLTERQRIIYDVIKKDGRVTAKSLAGTLAGTLAVSARTIERELTFLKNKGVIRKEGKSNKGVWIILQ